MLPLLACTPDPEPEPEPYGFRAHLDEAIALNLERMPLYGDMTDGASLELSELLIASERLLLDLAEDFDTRAAPFQAQGIPIVAADFVSMEDIGEPTDPPRWAGPWTDALEADLERALAGLNDAEADDFEGVCVEARSALWAIDDLEGEHEVHLAMTRHVVESAAYAALHAIDYAEASNGDTVSLSTDLVAIQLDALPWRLHEALDQRATTIHREGAGILVNDLPHIPFLEEYAAP